MSSRWPRYTLPDGRDLFTNKSGTKGLILSIKPSGLKCLRKVVLEMVDGKPVITAEIPGEFYSGGALQDSWLMEND